MTSLFGSNLQEIWKACKDTSSQAISLVSNPTETAVYYTKSFFWGRFWTWIYDAIEWLLPVDLHRTEKAQRVIQNTYHSFTEQLPQIIEDVKTFQSHLIGKEEDERELGAIRRRVSSWNQNTGPFIHFLQEENPKKDQLFSDHLQEKNSPLNLSKDHKAIHQTQKVISIEGYLNESLPSKALAHLAKGERLDEEEEQNLNRWIKKVNALENKMPVSIFHEALFIFVTQLKESHPDESPNLIDLEMELLDRNLQIFHQLDKNHYEDNVRLKTKDSITCNGKTWTLREQIGRKKEGLDKTLLFTVEEAPDRLAIFGINPAILALKKRIAEQEHWGIPFMRFLDDIDPAGKCAFVEVLHGSLEEQRWKSTVDTLSKKEQRILTPVINMIQWWIKKDFTPKDFSLKYLKFDKNERLTYSKLLFRNDFFSYPLVEDLVFQLANGNLSIFQFLMHSSGLYNHETRSFYETVATRAAKGKKINAKKQAAYHYIVDPTVVNRGKTLHKEIVELKLRVAKKLRTTYSIPDQKKLYSTINEVTLAYYQKTKSASILWPNMEEMVIEKVITLAQLEPLPSKRSRNGF